MENMQQHDAFAQKIAAEIADYAAGTGLASPAEQARLARHVFDVAAEGMMDETDMPTRISAPNALVEVLDENGGRLYRRYLELEYEETANGVRLIGEDMGGKETQIVFLSGGAIERMWELRGQGSEAPLCEE